MVVLGGGQFLMSEVPLYCLLIPSTPHGLQGYLTHKKTPSPRTLP